jgi:signal transduction histidine kinase
VLRARGAEDTEEATEDAAAEPGVVRIEVQDRGPGIPVAEQARVWEKFFRGTGAAALPLARGSGIGLAVVKALIEAQAGRVGLESRPGQGACFWFELPAAQEAPTAAAVPAA